MPHMERSTKRRRTWAHPLDVAVIAVGVPLVASLVAPAERGWPLWAAASVTAVISGGLVLLAGYGRRRRGGGIGRAGGHDR